VKSPISTHAHLITHGVAHLNKYLGCYTFQQQQDPLSFNAINATNNKVREEIKTFKTTFFFFAKVVARLPLSFFRVFFLKKKKIGKIPHTHFKLSPN
jgi:hypothetical protein